MSAAKLILLAFAVAMILQLPLIANPGYFSFDELQWWARADVGAFADLPWVDGGNLAVAQYRPVTFNLWLVLAWLFADTPIAMHLAFAVLGSVNASLLSMCVRRFDGRDGAALGAAATFVLTPYAAYAHGWTATLADILVVACALLAVLVLRSLQESAGWVTSVTGVVCVVALVALALGAKESAVALPLLLTATLWQSRRVLPIIVAIVLASTLVALYLTLRWQAFATIGSSDPTYAWHFANVPLRFLEYLIYPWVLPLFEIAPVLDKSLPRLVAAAAVLGLLMAALARCDWRLPGVWLVLFFGLLAPVLVLGIAYNHYAYLATTAAVAVPAIAWSGMDRIGKTAVVVAASICALHGLAVMLAMRDVGHIQQRFHADLVALVTSDRASTVRIRVENARNAWMLARFLHDVPSYRGVGLHKVSTVDGDATGATHRMLDDGQLRPVAPAQPSR